MPVEVIATVLATGNTLSEIRKFVAECKSYDLPSTAVLLEYPTDAFPVTLPDPTLADVEQLIVANTGHAADVELFPNSVAVFAIDFPETIVEQIECGDHIPVIDADGNYHTHTNLHIVVNPHCYNHTGG